MPFGWDDAAILGGAAISAYSQPDPPEQLAGNLVPTDPRQFEFYGDMLENFQTGGGDFGYGSYMRAGESQLQQALADQGIGMDSGYGQSQLMELIAQAQAYDAQNRRDYGLSLLRSPPSTAVITGENQIPGASAAGYGGHSEWNEQARALNEWNREMFGDDVELIPYV